MLVAELNKTRRIGCEFEMTVPRVGSGSGSDVQQTLANVLTANGVSAIARGYQHRLFSEDIAVEYDISVRGESRWQGVTWFPIEVKTRIVEGTDDWDRIIPKTLEICRYLGARVNRSCGHHIHIDFPEARTNPTVIRSLYNLIHRFEPILYGLIAPSRQENGYAKRMPDRTRLLHGCRTSSSFQQALARWDRHCGLNLTHLFGTSPRIEFRYHQGTLDPIKARHWMRLINRLVEHAVTRNCQAATKQVENSRKGLEAFRYTIGLRSNPKIYKHVSDELKETSKFFLKRWKHFNAGGSEGEE